MLPLCVERRDNCGNVYLVSLKTSPDEVIEDPEGEEKVRFQ